jgi:sarcosine oxidase, subunit beta
VNVHGNRMIIPHVAGQRADVVVVGAGLFGTSIAFELARRDAGRVVLVERESPAAGDSGLSFSMVRCHYSNEVTARLAMRGVEVIRRWEQEVGTGESGYVRTGYLLIADAERVASTRDNVERLRAWGLETRFVSPQEIFELEPLLAPDGIAGGAYEPDGGFADAQKMTLAWFAAGARLGVRALLGCRVRGLVVRGGRVCGVETDAGAIDAPVVVNAAGAWGPELVRAAGLDLPVALRRLQVAFVRQPADRPQARMTFSSMVTNLVFRPDRAGIAAVVAYQPSERLGSRDECRRELDPGYEEAIRTALQERLPAYARAEWVGGFAGAYDVTPDWNPLVGWAPAIDGLYLALGWSGHGFKLAPAVGEVVADEIVGREPAIDVSALAPERFQRGEELRLAYGPGARA